MCSTVPNVKLGRTVLLLASTPTLSKPQFLRPGIVAAAAEAQDRLVIVLFSRLFKSRGTRWVDVQNLLTYVYSEATRIAHDMGKVLLNIDVLLRGMDEGIPDIRESVDRVVRVSGDCLAAALPIWLARIPQRYVSRGDGYEYDFYEAKTSPSEACPVVAVGGTFDHLHAGHKILLSMAAWVANQKLIVGVTEDALLEGIAHQEILQDLGFRKAHVRKFLSLFSPSLHCDIVTISDMFGPTGWDANIQALVVSRETRSGAEAITAHRASHALPALKTFVINDIPSPVQLEPEELVKTKLGSTFIREWISTHKEISLASMPVAAV
ncbi:hypothetical protein CYLTODRAFT_426842 [Cylindrobasidium torrendii FP15055 ss-10]|uniref:Cytidyltransferase-like domain-containing protein n=1 Tax=Cylindrobasidium torrendii FP15055 ss-10 TaxID=1314674 RepID=A0A0D7AWD5_9AGAR|nr:hypothetical protein CYLTODRAFT_426842 [Cylindrobasidium torrendii FP15055 ss-10]